MSALSLEGRAGVVACASSASSMGFHIAEELLARGSSVTLACRPERAAGLEPLCESKGMGVVTLDFHDEASVEAAVAAVGQRHGRIDYLVHTAVSVPEGVLERSVLELTAAELAEVMEVGVRSLAVLARNARPWLRRSPAPRITTLLSAGADYAIPHYHAVGIAKAALASLVRYLAVELGPDGVLCNAVNFSILDTDAALRVIGSERTAKSIEHITRRSMTQRQLSAADVAKAVAFTSSAECCNMTAEIMTIDGGFAKNYF